jgi:hypothetical protein
MYMPDIGDDVVGEFITDELTAEVLINEDVCVCGLEWWSRGDVKDSPWCSDC